MILCHQDEADPAVILRVGQLSLPVVEIRPVPQVAHIAHVAFEHPGGLLHIRQAFIRIESAPFTVFPRPHRMVCRQVFLPRHAAVEECFSVIFFHRRQQAPADQVCPGKAVIMDLTVQHQGIPEKPPRRVPSDLRVRRLAYVQILPVVSASFPADFLVDEHLLFQSPDIRQPQQVLRGIPSPFHVPGYEHPSHMGGELVPRVVVFIRAVQDRRLMVCFQAACDQLRIFRAVISLSVFFPVFPDVHAAVPPHMGDKVKVIYMRLDIGTVDDPVIRASVLHRVCEFSLYELRRILEHGNVVRGLEIVKRYMVVDPILPGIIFFRQRRDPGVMVPLSPSDHLPKPVVRPDLDHIIRQL